MSTNNGGPRPESHVKISKSVYARAFGAEIVLLDFNRGEYFGLDEVGAEVWRRLEAGDSLNRVAEVIVELYEVQKETALADVLNLVATLSEHSLVSIEPTAA